MFAGCGAMRGTAAGGEGDLAGTWTSGTGVASGGSVGSGAGISTKGEVGGVK